MKKFWAALMIAVLGVTVAVSGAEAKRLGGGGSFGKSSPTFSRPAPMQNTNQAAAAPRPAQPAAPAPASPWKGILGGALLGLGLGALLSHFGLGGAFASMIGTLLMVALIAFAALMLFRLLARKQAGPQEPRPAYAGPGYQDTGAPAAAQDNRPLARSMTPEIGSNLGGGAAPVAGTSTVATSVPADFDTAGFLRHAKSNFIRMQAAWDKADVNDIREFTTPEMYGELKMQLTERGATSNHTDVVSIDAELLGIETTQHEYLASVRFHGMIREAEHAAAEPFSEVWVLTKPVSGQGGWLLAGLHQN
jgi:predicted lipid-binding transport protein (Tim44 family)